RVLAEPDRSVSDACLLALCSTWSAASCSSSRGAERLLRRFQPPMDNKYHDGRSNWLHDFARSVWSQNGEDGIIEKVLEICAARDRWCVEFGAWDGVYLSNTRRLIVDEGYSAVLIEGDHKKYGELRRNYRDYPNVIPICGMVGFEQH